MAEKIKKAALGDEYVEDDGKEETKLPTSFTVTFESNGGTSIEALEVESGEKATKPENPTKEATETEEEINTAIENFQ
ncbi:MAG: InlB B-repeat-containing protein [Treponema sp.]|nr:InlB B-repeat-containing protein [Treponema sp.]